MLVKTKGLPIAASVRHVTNVPTIKEVELPATMNNCINEQIHCLVANNA